MISTGLRMGVVYDSPSSFCLYHDVGDDLLYDVLMRMPYDVY